MGVQREFGFEKMKHMECRVQQGREVHFRGGWRRMGGRLP